MRKLSFISASVFALSACSGATTSETESAVVSEQAEEIVQPVTYETEAWITNTLPEIAAAIRAGDLSAEEVTKAYIARIEAIDWSGPELRSVLALNPDAVFEAQAADEARAAGEDLGPLHGVPILLKDNIETLDNVATTAGALALKDNITERDSPLVAGLRAQGAIILGKTNLSQWANFRSSDSNSGWTALGGQVKNPHMLDRNPCGSSSGSGAAVAASLSAAAVGTETNGSIICPSTINGVVGFKPTVGLVSQEFIIPISSSQDTAGPMTKTVSGAAMMLNAMATGEAKTDYVVALDAGSLDGARIGVLRFAQGENADIVGNFNEALGALEAAGAQLVEIEEFETATENFFGKSRNVLRTEFKATLNDYLASTPDTVSTRTLDELIAFNEANADVELALFDQSIFVESAKAGGIDGEEYLAARDDVQAAAGRDGIDALLGQYNVDILVAPSGPIAPRIDPINGDVWPSWAGAGYLAAIAGYPNLTVPMGTVHGLPVGISFMGAKNADADILSIGFAYEQRTLERVDPQYLENAEQRPEIAKAVARKK